MRNEIKFTDSKNTNKTIEEEKNNFNKLILNITYCFNNKNNKTKIVKEI